MPDGDRVISTGKNPGRRALEQREVTNERLDVRDKLDGRCPCPNYGHALARQVAVVIPLRRVEQYSLKALDAWYGRKPDKGGRPERNRQETVTETDPVSCLL